MTSNPEAAHAYLSERRATLAYEIDDAVAKRDRIAAHIATLQGRLTEIDYLLEELGAVPATTKSPRRQSAVAAKAWMAETLGTAASAMTGVGLTPPMPVVSYTRDIVTAKPAKSETHESRIRALLIASGDAGLRADAAAEQTGIPFPTASATLSNLVKKGHATHQRPHYFATEAAPKASRPRQKDRVREALIAVGEAGATSKELAEVVGLPWNQTAGLLSALKASGEAVHQSRRYYAQ